MHMPRPSEVAVVIPFYRQHLTADEQRSLNAWREHLSHYDTYIASPPGLHPPDPKMHAKYFLSKDFRSVRSYSELLLSPRFYEAFRDYEYILIYQLDALVFHDDLPHWVKTNLSYIGAPWGNSVIGQWTSPTRELKGGNGGLSLRCVSECLAVLEQVQREAQFNLPFRFLQWSWFSLNFLWGQLKKKWMLVPATQYPFNEDGFWSFEAPKYRKSFHAASEAESRAFAFETNPAAHFQKTKQKLPFGVHAWQKYDPVFWRQFINS